MTSLYSHDIFGFSLMDYQTGLWENIMSLETGASLEAFGQLVNGPRHAKTCLRAYAGNEGPDQPAHPHILIRTLLSASLSANIIGYYRVFQWRANARMRLCACARWCESAYFAHARRHSFAWRSPNKCIGLRFHPLLVVKTYCWSFWSEISCFESW